MTPDRIILHHSGGTDGPVCNTSGIRKWHMGTPPNGPADGPYRDVAYHCLVEQINGEYEAIIGRPWDWTGAHTLGQNNRALGICLVGNFNMVSPPDAQLRVAARVVAMWCRMFTIPVTEIYRHSFFNDTDCPGYYFDLDQFKSMVLDA
jgi:hypothetical protein